MSKEKRKHANKGATGATVFNSLIHKIDLLHPDIFFKGATRVQQGATESIKTKVQHGKAINYRCLNKCCMLHPCLRLNF